MLQQKEKILIIGGAGYIGAHTNKLLSSRGYETFVLDNLSTGRREFAKWGEFIEGDMSDTYILNRIFASHKITTVIHFANFTDLAQARTEPQKYYEKNIEQMLRLLNEMQKYQVKNLILSFPSDLNIFKPDALPFDDYYLENLRILENSKLLIEQIVQDYHKSNHINYLTIKYSNAVGADDDLEIGEWRQPETHIIPIILDAISSNRNENLKVDKNHIHKPFSFEDDYIHVNDLAEAHFKGFMHLLENKNSGTILLKNEQSFNLHEIVETIFKISGKRMSIANWGDLISFQRSDVFHQKKQNKRLNWLPVQSSLENIIRSSWNWRLARDKRHSNVA